jgi:hypothetical protein
MRSLAKGFALSIFKKLFANTVAAQPKKASRKVIVIRASNRSHRAIFVL